MPAHDLRKLEYPRHLHKPSVPGEWVYVVDLKTGQLIRKMGTGAGGLTSTGTPIIGSFAGYLAGDGSVKPNIA